MNWRLFFGWMTSASITFMIASAWNHWVAELVIGGVWFIVFFTALQIAVEDS